jgi:hypothetical protein
MGVATRLPPSDHGPGSDYKQAHSAPSRCGCSLVASSRSVSPHPGLDRTKGMFDRLTTTPHGKWVLIEAALNIFEKMFVFPARDTALNPGCATMLDRAGSAGVGPVSCPAAMDLRATVGGSRLVSQPYRTPVSAQGANRNHGSFYGR